MLNISANLIKMTTPLVLPVSELPPPVNFHIHMKHSEKGDGLHEVYYRRENDDSNSPFVAKDIVPISIQLANFMNHLGYDCTNYNLLPLIRVPAWGDGKYKGIHAELQQRTWNGCLNLSIRENEPDLLRVIFTSK